MLNLKRWRSVANNRPALNAYPGSCRRAFTLLELMIAIAMFTLVIACIYATWLLIMKSAQVGQIAAGKAQRQRIAMGTIENALMCIQSFQASQKYYSFIVDNSATPTLSFAARLPEGFPRDGKFQNFKLRRVTFSLEAGANQENDLVLRQNPILMDMDDDEQKNPLVLAKDVKAFSIECWDTNQVDWVTEWDNTNAIPPMVRIGLVLGSGNDDHGNYSATGNGADQAILRAFSLPSTMMPAAVQMGGGGPGGNPFNAPPPPPPPAH